jgi:predicted nucleic acid-binding protein
MTSSLVDSNVLIDLLANSPLWGSWSFRQIDRASQEGLVINQIVFAETAAYFLDFHEMDRVLSSFKVTREELPWHAAAAAGLVHVKYRRRGGVRDRVLPDFLIGAHALAKGHRLLTRDARRYRTYFPKLDIIAPDSHP